MVGVSKRVPIQFEGTNQQIIEVTQTITPEQRAHLHESGNLVICIRIKWSMCPMTLKESA